MISGTVRTPWILILLVACSAKQPTVDEALGGATTSQPHKDVDSMTLTETGVVYQEELGRTARDAREVAISKPANIDAQVAAAAALFESANFEIDRRVIVSLDDDPPKTVMDLLQRQGGLASEVKGRVVTLAEEGARCASLAIEIDPERSDARYYYAVNLGLTAWGKGAAEVVLQGLAPKVKNAFAAAMAADPDFDGAAPRRANAGFLGRAPWPLGDGAEAVEQMRLAVKAAPTAVNHAVLAEVLWRTGDRPAAIAEWENALTAGRGSSTATAVRFARELARRALALAQR